MSKRRFDSIEIPGKQYPEGKDILFRYGYKSLVELVRQVSIVINDDNLPSGKIIIGGSRDGYAYRLLAEQDLPGSQSYSSLLNALREKAKTEGMILVDNSERRLSHAEKNIRTIYAELGNNGLEKFVEPALMPELVDETTTKGGVRLVLEDVAELSNRTFFRKGSAAVVIYDNPFSYLNETQRAAAIRRGWETLIPGGYMVISLSDEIHQLGVASAFIDYIQNIIGRDAIGNDRGYSTTEYDANPQLRNPLNITEILKEIETIVGKEAIPRATTSHINVSYSPDDLLVLTQHHFAESFGRLLQTEYYTGVNASSRRGTVFSDAMRTYLNKRPDTNELINATINNHYIVLRKPANSYPAPGAGMPDEVPTSGK